MNSFSEPYQREIRVVTVQVLSKTGEILYSILDETSQGRKTNAGQASLDFIQFTESLDNYIQGELIFDGSRNQFEILQGRGNEQLRIAAASYAKNENDNLTNVDIIEFPIFSIVSVDDASNMVDLDKGPEGNKSRKIKLSFCTLEASQIFQEEDSLPIGFIGKISSGVADENEEEEEGEEPIVIDKGLIETLNENFFLSPVDSEETLNDIWVHPNISTFPTRKLSKTMTPIQLLSYAKEYAVSAQNPDAVNYKFWHDLNGWHFKSIESISREYEEFDDGDLVTFNISSNVIDRDRVFRLDIIKDHSDTVSFYDLALYSYYIRYSPDYELHHFHRFMGDREKYTSKKIVYNYKNVEPLLTKINPNTVLFPDLSSDDLIEKENSSLRVHDNLFGWQNTRGFDDDEKVDNFILIGEEVLAGPSGGSGEQSEEEEGLEEDENETDLSFIEPVNQDFSGYQEEMFQEMFDCIELDGSLLKVIVENIKRPIWQNKKDYRELLHKKEKYNLYKYSVCCDVADTAEEPLKYALLTGHKKIEKNIYRYNWKEVAILPKAEVGNFLGIGLTADDIVGPSESSGFTQESQFYNATVNELNQIRIPDDIDPLQRQDDPTPNRPMNYQFIKFPSNPEKRSIVTLSTVGELSGEFLILPPEGSGEGEDGPTFEFENKVTDGIAKYFTEAPYSGLTLTFHNSHYSPFLIVEKPNAIRGVVTNPSGAYNLNEIMNRRIYNENDYPSITADNIIYYQGKENSPYNMPGDYTGEERPPFSKLVDELVGPGVNATKKEYTDYPDAFTMMPVGSYRRVEKSGSEGNITYGEKLDCSAIPIGQIVRISTISYDDLVKYGLDTRDFASRQDKKLYYFNATNAHDGMCDGTCSF